MTTPHTTCIHCNSSPTTNSADLIGAGLRRELSCLLVMALLLVSAITFSTNEIPNFKPDCKTSTVQKNPSATTIAVVRHLSVVPIKNAPSSTPDCSIIPASTIPPVSPFPLANISRGPPEYHCSSLV